MLTSEMLKLQGFPTKRLARPSGVSARQFQCMIGNAFSVNVMGRVALKLLKTVGLVKEKECPDVWAKP